jgi:hypothetical protein
VSGGRVSGGWASGGDGLLLRWRAGAYVVLEQLQRLLL